MPRARALANDLDYRRSMENVVETMYSLKDTADSKEALRAFAEKRAARYSRARIASQTSATRVIGPSVAMANSSTVTPSATISQTFMIWAAEAGSAT